MVVRWIADTSKVRCVILNVSTDGQQTFHQMNIAGCTSPWDGDWGSYAWVVPQVVGSYTGDTISSPRTACYVRAHEFVFPGEDAYFDLSNGPFTITP
jgi:hypothetical protein